MPDPAASTFAAVDLGASGGRVVVGIVDQSSLHLTEVHRFANTPIHRATGLHWDIASLYRNVLTGVGAAAEHSPRSVGIDSWGVDYGLLDGDGALLEEPHHYRDSRTSGAIAAVLDRVTAAELYRVTGLQQLPINTVYQLAAARGTPQLEAAHTLLLMPDLLTYWLTGEIGAEATNASTTQLYDVRSSSWAHGLMRRLDLPTRIFPALRRPGEPAGTLCPTAAEETSLPSTVPVTTVASHDTASAVAAVPATGGRFAYISCGTWSLVGLELESPVLTEASRAANFTNELGIDGTTRYLRNTMGLWLLQECLRRWAEQGLRPQLSTLLDQVARTPAFTTLVNPDDPAFLAPQDMLAAIAEVRGRLGEPVPANPAATVRCLLESLAVAHRRALRDAATLADRDVDVVHMVGGGSRNDPLCQLTADACGLPVIAGPAEATATGNILVQARAHGLLGDRWHLRELVAESQPRRRFEPRGDEGEWAAAEARAHS